MTALALVLGGGNALGAYDAGAYEALAASGREPDWIAGASIGAITGALIAGNPPEARLDRLEAFWRRAVSPDGMAGGALRRSAQLASAMQTRLLGRPDLFRMRVPLLSREPGRLGLYDAGPMRRALLDLVDFDRLNGGAIRFSLVAVDLASGEEVAFDTGRDRIGVDHLMASAALIPDFPAVEVDGRWLVDGGLADNVPVDLVLSEPPEDELLCFAVDPFPRSAALPESLLDVAERQNDLIFACQTERTLRFLAERDRLRRQAAPGLPGAEVFRLQYDGGTAETALKGWDFSRAALTRRWRAGRSDMEAALRRLAEASREAPGTKPALTIHPPIGPRKA